MIQAVIFDIDNTLYDYDAAHAVAFQALTEYAQHTLGVDPEEFESLHQRANQLRQAGLRLGVGTDMTADWQYAKLERLNLLPLLDFVVTSEEVTQEKPGARFFQLCREKAGCPASACVFVGDNRSKDVEGAKRVGMRPVWYRPHSGPDAPLLVDSVLEVRRLDHLSDYLLSLLGANHEKEDVS